MSYDPQKSTWVNPNIEYLFSGEIIEYDMRDAGFNLIQQYRLLPQEKIQELMKLGKGETRHRAIGILQGKDKAFSKALLDKFAEIRTVFISANNLSDNNIISVKKDAIYTIGQCSKLQFGRIEFAEKNKYSSYVRFTDNMGIEVYYSSNTVDIKGMGDSAINRHRLYMLDFIKSMISYLEQNNSYAKRYLRGFTQDYKMGDLDEEFYVEFNNLSRDLNPIFNYQKIIIPFTQITLKELG